MIPLLNNTMEGRNADLEGTYYARTKLILCDSNVLVSVADRTDAPCKALLSYRKSSYSEELIVFVHFLQKQ